MSYPWPYPIPPVTSARVHDYLAGGKDNFRADRLLAEQLLHADPRYLDLVHANTAWQHDAVRTAADAGVDQFLVFGPGMPRLGETPLHTLAQLHHPYATTVYVDHDPQVVVAARALWRTCGVTVLDGDLTETEHLLADPALHTALETDRPVAAVCALVLQHLDDTEVTAWAIALAAALPEGSHLAITHPGPELELVAGTYTTATYEAGAPGRYLTRTPEHLDQLLKGWALQEVEVAEHGLLTATARLP